MRKTLHKQTVLFQLVLLLWVSVMPFRAVSQSTSELENCIIKTFPFSEGFASYSAAVDASFPECWLPLTNFSSLPKVTSSASHKDANSITVAVGNNNHYSMLITPFIDANISSLRLNFAFRSVNNAKLEVGVMTDNEDVNSFESVQVIAYDRVSNFKEFTVDFTEYKGSGNYIAFKWSTISLAASGYIDNIEIISSAACLEARFLNVSNIAGSSALATWQPSLENSSEYDIEVETLDSVAVISQHISNTQYRISGLSINTDYRVKVRARCNNDHSGWITQEIKTTFSNDCAAPNLFAVINVRQDRATLVWAKEGYSENYLIEYRANGASIWTQKSLYEHASLIEYLLPDLSPNTGYTVRMAAICVNGDTTNWLTASFRTLCMPHTTLPFVENFDNVSGGSTTNSVLPACWTINCTSSTGEPYVAVQGDYVSAFGALNLDLSPGTTNIAILPALDLSERGLSISGLQVNFMAQVKTTTTGEFILGVMDDPKDATTFTPIETLTPFTSANEWVEFSIPLNNYQEAGNHIAFLWRNGSSYAALIDNLYIDVITACSKPTNFVIGNRTNTTVNFSWDNTGASSWQAVCVASGETPDWSSALPFTGNSGTISNLLPGTKYDIYFRAVCNSENSFPVFTSFSTLCGEITEQMLPYSEPFEVYGLGTGSFPNCWSRNGSAPYIYSTYTAGNSFGSLYFASSSTAQTAITGKFSDVSTLQVEFQARFSDITNGQLVVGVMSDTTASATFVPVSTVYGKNINTWEKHTVYLTSYTESGQNIAFRKTGTYTVYLDDVVISLAKECAMPDNMVAINITDESATILWDERGNASTWEIVYGPAGFNIAEQSPILAEQQTFTITDLKENTLYDVYVRAVCGEEQSDWVNEPLTFRTKQTPANMPYSTNFENDEDNAKWLLINHTQTNKWYIDTTVNNTVQGSKSLYISNTNGTRHAYSSSASYVFALRPFDFTSASTYEISFDWIANGEKDYDLMRVFLVPIEVNLEAEIPTAITGGRNETPEGWIDVVGTPLLLNNTWKINVSEFNVVNVGYYNLVFFWKNDNMDPYQFPAAIDNISIGLQGCLSPTNFALTDVQTTEATVTWNQRGLVSEWEVHYSRKGSGLGAGISNTSNTTTHTITGLLPDYTAYDVYVRAICGSGDASSWVGPIHFQTLQSVANLPYECNFENSAENNTWGLFNGSAVNKWHIGEAATSNGQKSLYISNTGGTTHTYELGTTSYVYAMKSLNFTNLGTYEVEFDWKAGGRATTDALRAFLVPATKFIEADDAYGMEGIINTTPDGWIALVDGVLSQNSTWEQYYAEVTITNPGIYNLVFLWKSYVFRDGIQPPAVVDNIAVFQQTCATPHTLKKTDVSNSETIITWEEKGTATQWEIQYGLEGFELGTGTTISVTNKTHNLTGLYPNTAYDVYVRAVCDATDTSRWSSKFTFTAACALGTTLSLPYLESFDTYEQDGTPITNDVKNIIPSCWIVAKTGNVPDYPYITNLVGGNNSHSAPYSMIFGQTPNGHSLAILPQIAPTIPMSEIQIAFWNKVNGGTDGIFSVGVMDSPDINATFTTIAHYTEHDTTTYQQQVVSLENYNGTGRYIAFKWENGTTGCFLMDDLIINYNSSLCNAPILPTVSKISGNQATIIWYAGGSETAWRIDYKKVSETTYSAPIQVSSPTHILTHLEEDTDYEVRVRAVCDNNITSNGTIVRFKTMPLVTYTITASAGDNGRIDPANTVYLNMGEEQLYTFYPDMGYEVKYILVNDDSVGNGTTYTIEDIRENMTIHVEFQLENAISQYQLENSIFIHPNPTSEQLHVRLSTAFEQWEITNLLGQIIHTAPVNEFEFTVNVSDYRSGVYFIHLRGKQGVATKKFIKE